MRDGRWVMEHLCSRLSQVKPTGLPQRLHGGLLNYVWRVPAEPASVIVKAGPPFVATAPSVPLAPERALFEARSLQALSPGGLLDGVPDEGVRPPRLLDLDEQHYVLIIEDAGDVPHLGTMLRQGEPVAALGARLGTFIGRLHAASMNRPDLAARFNNQAVQRTRHDVQYRAVEWLLRKAGVPDAGRLGTRAILLGERLQRPGTCFIMGDLWPPSLLVTSAGVRLIDWEFAHFGSPAQDVGHFAAHLWMQAHRAPLEAVTHEATSTLQYFLHAYAEAVGAVVERLGTPHVLEEAALHFGAEILVRTVGPFQDGYLYDGLPPEAPAVREAVSVAADYLRLPSPASLFAPLCAG